MEVTGFSTMLVSTYETTWYDNPEYHNQNFRRHENPKSHNDWIGSEQVQ
jgi:hypothetical protein